ncbi:DUF1934 family protein [Shouchella clausii]|jgi:uncharacterized beta-barrel protein YwiB (DUF1934 family)|uniref:DUF1934 domain-containing protein n=3 Tax=Shouchella TaxID=2893057 RepID=Q5WB33_SHOC1|nr:MULTISPECIES: DUF1934 family protein [Shouchella]MCM3311231.1 DUF1934 family protein [Psychrobacillus sp. MER TA 17]ALA53130.1 hypothetical protein DB29_02302 [Shouchella clausii]KKI84927.1 hypothetical protein WZ76_18355 [Shouchella clausii]MBU3231325.1 DUF1934 family protein [Shouchella clausii]MBU3263672.1 DUF1934 family protein [Shouchella clausii]
MKRKVKISFQTTTFIQGQQPDAFSFDTEGDLYIKGSASYLRFKETHAHKQDVFSTMKWDGRELMLIRQGTIIMRQSFLAKEETYGRYVTPEASWETKARTDTLLVQLPTGAKQKGRIYVRYQFFLQGQLTGEHEIRLAVERIE